MELDAFGERDVFAIEVGRVVENEHCQLDFYLRDFHLNAPDNTAYLGVAVWNWPTLDRYFTEIYWDLPMSSGPETLLRQLEEEPVYRESHSVFSLGPVTDSFRLYAFNWAGWVLLVAEVNEGFGERDPSEAWSALELASEGCVRWLSVSLLWEHFQEICRRARTCLAKLDEARRAPPA